MKSLPGYARVGVLVCAACQDPAGPKQPLETSAAATQPLSFRQVSVGGHSCGVTTDDRAYCWGGNLWGQLGDGTRTNRSRPVAVQTELRFRSVSAGGQHTCAVTTDDRAFCWGFGAQGKLGDGRGGSSSTPVAVDGQRRFKQVSAGNSHSCAVTRWDRVFCWGSNASGQLGDGTTTERAAPVAVHATGRLFRQVSAGASFTCAVTPEGPAYCWGLNFDGQLGDGTRIDRFRPVAVYGERRFSQVTAGEFHSCAVTLEKRALCWGSNRHGQLGIGDPTLRRKLRPAAVAGALHWETVSAGRYHGCAVTGGAAHCWGENSAGQLGDGTALDRPAPAVVAGGLQFIGLGTGPGHSCGVTPAGMAYCWGANGKGGLGNGTTVDSRTPVPVESTGQR